MKQPTGAVNDAAHPFENEWRRYCADIAGSTSGLPPEPLHKLRLKIIEGIARFFRQHQREDGAVIDPYYKTEWHYSTPCYAFAAAFMVREGDESYRPSAEQALVHASQLLADNCAPQDHGDFFTVYLMLADRLLTSGNPDSDGEPWRKHLRRIDPGISYAFSDHKIARDKIHNWNAINLTGEFLRHQAGLGGDPDYWERHLPLHLKRFSSLGLYRDGAIGSMSNPLAYDAVTRMYFALLLSNGYQGNHAPMLRMHLLRSLKTSLFMQSPTGECPSTGRSSQHAWNEAALAACYEWGAEATRESDPELAAACKRGARLALLSILPWLRPDGDLQIVKNRFDPCERHGHERYSIHTTYNLWTASALALGDLMANTETLEKSIPSEASSYGIFTGADFHQVICANRGCYFQVDVMGDVTRDPSGLVRLNRTGCNSQIGPSDGAVPAPLYTVLGTTDRFLSHAPAWQDHLGNWHRLAGIAATPEGAQAHLLPVVAFHHEPDGTVRCTIDYFGCKSGARHIRLDYRLTPENLTIGYEAEGRLAGLRAEFPLFAYDGLQYSDIRIQEDAIRVEFRGSRLTIRPLSPEVQLTMTEDLVAIRTGLLRYAYAETRASSIQFRMTLEAF